jgi:hypothetical protein
MTTMSSTTHPIHFVDSNTMGGGGNGGCKIKMLPKSSTAGDVASLNNSGSRYRQTQQQIMMAGAANQQGLDRALRLRSMLAMPPSSTTTISSNQNRVVPLKQPTTSGSRLRHASAPSLLRRHIRHASSGTFSNASTNSSGSTSNHNQNNAFRGNAVMQVAQRSNGSTVKSVIADLQRICEECNATSNNTTVVEAPLHEVEMLSQWASVDAYYKVVISKYQGIPTIVLAMTTFPDDADVQTFCCSTLKSLTNKLLIHQADGVPAILQAMTNHPSSIVVQSEALEALRFQAPLLPQEPPEVLQPLVALLEHAQEMYLTQMGTASAQFLSRFLATIQPKTVAPTTTTTPTTTVHWNGAAGMDFKITT